MIWKYMKTNFKEFCIWIIKAPERDEIDGILYVVKNCGGYF